MKILLAIAYVIICFYLPALILYRLDRELQGGKSTPRRL